MANAKRREVVESVLNRNQRREAEINEALKQEAARRAAVVKNMHRLRALRLQQDKKSQRHVTSGKIAAKQALTLLLFIVHRRVSSF